MKKLLLTGALILSVASSFADVSKKVVRTTCFNTDSSNKAIPYAFRYNPFLQTVEFKATLNDEYKLCETHNFGSGPKSSILDAAFPDLKGPDTALGSTLYICRSENGIYSFMRQKEKTLALGTAWYQFFAHFQHTDNNETLHDDSSKHTESLIVANGTSQVESIDDGSLDCPDAGKNFRDAHKQL